MKRTQYLLLLTLICGGPCLAQSYRASGHEWKQPIQIALENPGDFPRKSELVIIRPADLGIKPGSAYSGIRLVDPSAQPDEEGEAGGNDIPFEIDQDEFSFAMDLAPREKKELCLFIPKTPEAPPKDYSTTTDLTLDMDAGKIGNSLLEVDFSTPAKKSPTTAMSYKGEKLVSDTWLYVSTQDRKTFRNRGPVTELKAVCNGPVRRRVLLSCQPDEESLRSEYRFEVSIEVTTGSPSVLLRVDTIPREYQALHAQLYATVWPPDPEKDMFYFFELGGRFASLPPKSKEAYGRMTFDVTPPWLMLYSQERKKGVAVGAPQGDVDSYLFAVGFKRFELLRPHILVNPREPLIYCTTFDFGDDPERIAEIQQARNLPIAVSVGGSRCEMVERLAASRPLADEPVPPPDISRTPPSRDLTPGVAASDDSIRASTGDMALTIDKRTGAITELRCGGSKRELPNPGGFWFVRWPERKEIGAAGEADGWKVEKDLAAFSWRSEGIQRKDTLKANNDCLEWIAAIENEGEETQLLEVRFSLPLDAEPDGWCFWDGSFAYRLSKDQSRVARGFTTLSPGGRTSQGIFPSAAIWDGQMGIAVGLRPMDIYSFYGAVADPGAGPQRAFNSALRLVIPPKEKREAAFVIYAVDPNWGWRSCLDRYYALFPDVFTAPTRDDIWGLYSTAGPTRINEIGEKYIDLCRRYRVGGMELYGPFTRTGEFYPDEEPCYARLEKGRVNTLTREQMKEVFDICNIATCTLSYVIPTKCNRALALEKYQDSIIKEKNGDFFVRDYWCVIGNPPDAGGPEKLAGMFAWGNRYGERLKNDIRRIVDNYRPEGFYFDNGSFVWEDYARQLPFSSFDDDGKVYTNGGIAYALIQEDLKAYAPAVHRNPGEFIQYFSGFRGQSHLTNCVSTQTNYIRSHRFIMGNKPIFVAHPRDYHTRQDLQKAMIVGGLPWLTRIQTQGPKHMELVRGFADVCIALARAGWRPITGAVCDATPHVRSADFSPSPERGRAKALTTNLGAVGDMQGVRVERFGDGLGSFLVIVNENTAETAVNLVVNSAVVGDGVLVFGDFFERVALNNHIDPGSNLTSIQFTIPMREAVVLRASASVSDAKSPLVMSSRANGREMEYAIASPQEQNLRLALRPPFKGRFAGKAELQLRVSGDTKATVAVVPDVICHPDEAAVAKFDLLAGAKPVRVVIPNECSQEEMYDARRIKGFHAFQADLLKKKESSVALAPGGFDDLRGAVVIGLASRPEIQKTLRDRGADFAAEGDAGIVASVNDGAALLITSGTERGLREALWDYLRRIEMPLPDDDMKTEELALPHPSP